MVTRLKSEGLFTGAQFLGAILWRAGILLQQDKFHILRGMIQSLMSPEGTLGASHPVLRALPLLGFVVLGLIFLFGIACSS